MEEGVEEVGNVFFSKCWRVAENPVEGEECDVSALIFGVDVVLFELPDDFSDS